MDREESYEARPSRPWVGCGKVDKAPRDQVALSDGNTAFYHMDCHVLIADCKVCKDALKAVANGHDANGKKDEELWNALTLVPEQPENKRPKIFTTVNASGDPNVKLEEGVK
jgi:hypothetical protein